MSALRNASTAMSCSGPSFLQGCCALEPVRVRTLVHVAPYILDAQAAAAHGPCLVRDGGLLAWEACMRACTHAWPFYSAVS